MKEGSQVRQGEVLAKIYDEEVQIQKKAAEYALGAAYKAATDDVQIRYAKKSAAVAEKKYEVDDRVERVGRQGRGRVDDRQGQARMGRGDPLGREGAARSGAGEVRIPPEEGRARRGPIWPSNAARFWPRSTAKWSTIYRHQDEWVSPGDAILRLVRLDTMLVEGALEQSAYDPHEVSGSDVTVEVEMARGRKEQFTGRITYVSSLVRLDGRYIVRAEVANRQEHGRWLLARRHDGDDDDPAQYGRRGPRST